MRQVLFVVALMSTMSCGGGGDRSLPATPLSPSSPTPTPRQTFTLSGTVSETAPTASTRIAGVTVDVFCCGPNAGRSAITDANGVFQLALEPGTFTIRTRAANYVEGSQAVTLTGNQTVTIELDPVFQMVTTTRNESISGGDTCPGYWDYLSPTGAAEPCKVDYLLNVHHNGTLTAELTSTDRDTTLSLDLYRSHNGQPSGSALSWRGDGSVSVFAHTQYVLRVRKFASGGGPPPAGITPFSLTVTRPN